METNIDLSAQRTTTQVSVTLSGDLGGAILTPGFYKTTNPVTIQTGDLILDAQGDEDALWVFQLASDFSTVGGAGGNVILRGGAKAKNIFWETERLASIGEGTSFKGNILARMTDQDEAAVPVILLIDEQVPTQKWNALSAFKKQSIMGWPLYGQRL